MKLLLLLLSLVIPSFLSSCTNFIVGYEHDVQQGNILNQEDFDQIKPGMTNTAVKIKLGDPVLSNAINTNTYYYVYTFKPGHKKTSVKKFIVYFKDDKVTHTSLR
jgi:outer membrane protein assembly factor BamE